MKDITTRSLLDERTVPKENLEIWSKEKHTDDITPDIGTQVSEDSGHDGDSLGSQELDDSESDFEEKIMCLLHTGQTEDPLQGMRRSE